jgi:hypothetical protein
MEEMQALYFQVFNTPHGKRVYEDLQRKYRENTDLTGREAQLYYERGQRDVVKYIEKMVTRGGETDGDSTSG